MKRVQSSLKAPKAEAAISKPIDKVHFVFQRAHSQHDALFSFAHPHPAPSSAIAQTSDAWRFMSPNEQALLEAQAANASGLSKTDYAINVEELIADDLREQECRPTVQLADEVSLLLSDALFRRVVMFL
jgi:hypothetical protein